MIWIWFCVTDLTLRGPTTKQKLKIPRYASEYYCLVTRGIHYQIPPSHWLDQYHPSEASSVRRCAYFIATISSRREAIIIQVQLPWPPWPTIFQPIFKSIGKLVSYVWHKLIMLESRKHHTDHAGTNIRSDH